MASPINVNDILTFRQIGVDPNFATISNTALSSDRYLCILENSEFEKNVVIVDLKDRNSLNRFKIKADAAVMHPSRNIFTLRWNNTLQVFDLSTRTELKNDVFSFIAGSNVFQWSLSSNSNPIMVFGILPQIESCNVICYSVSNDFVESTPKDSPSQTVTKTSVENQNSQILTISNAGVSVIIILLIVLIIIQGKSKRREKSSHSLSSSNHTKINEKNHWNQEKTESLSHPNNNSPYVF